MLKEKLKKCATCKLDCPSRIIGMYANDVGFDFFIYQWENNQLPQQIQFAFKQAYLLLIIKDMQFLNFLKTLL